MELSKINKVEIIGRLCYIKYKERHLLPADASKEPHSKDGVSQASLFLFYRDARPAANRAGNFLLTLISLIEKGKQCNEQTAGRNQQTDYSETAANKELTGLYLAVACAAVFLCSKFFLIFVQRNIIGTALCNWFTTT